ncbi:MAG: alpha-L-rhamnosidase, partial [Proteiniphilum sp.]
MDGMFQNSLFLLVIHLLINPLNIGAREMPPPHELTVNMLPAAEQVFLNGYPVPTPLEEAVTRRENYQFTEISTHHPSFGWMVRSTTDNTKQTAYRILIASNEDIMARDSADLWDTGKISSIQSINIPYEGKQLEPGKVYFWKVKTWDNQGRESAFSDIARFKTADMLVTYATDRYPIQKQDDYPVSIERVNDNVHFADFGKASFGRLRVNLYSETGTDCVTILLG